MSVGAPPIPAVVTETEDITPLVRRFRFARRDGGPMPSFSGGAHTVVEMHDAGTRRLNPYSLMSDPGERGYYEISVRRDDRGRGGSLFMHNSVRQGTELNLSAPVNLFPVDLRARRHLMIAGGIGITPFIAQMEQLSQAGGRFELHYINRSREFGAYAEALRERHGGLVHLYFPEQDGSAPDLRDLLAGQRLGTTLYVCGPPGLIDAVRSLAAELGWPPQSVRSEEFLAPPVGQPFTVELAGSGRQVEVGATQSFLEALEAAGLEPPYLCRGGACGQCETDVLACDGIIEHHDHWLTPDQKAAGTKVMPCVSRFRGSRLVIDR